MVARSAGERYGDRTVGGWREVEDM